MPTDHPHHLSSLLQRNSCQSFHRSDTLGASSPIDSGSWVFHNKNLHLNTKISIYQAACITTLLYSCEAWVLYRRSSTSPVCSASWASLGVTERLTQRSGGEQATKALRPQSPSTTCAGWDMSYECPATGSPAEGYLASSTEAGARLVA